MTLSNTENFLDDEFLIDRRYGYGYEDEEWCDILSFPNYMISTFGRVWSIKRELFLKPRLTFDGYERVNLSKNGKLITIRIHQLVADTFLFRPPGTSEVNHIDGDKTYNYVDNLEWVSHRENILHAYQNELIIPAYKRIKIIETEEIFESEIDCAFFINGNSCSISNCLSGRQKSHRGFTFQYVD